MNSTRRVVAIELDPSWADEHIDCYSCSYPITDWDDVVAVPTAVTEDDVPSGAIFVHRVCPNSNQEKGRPEGRPS